MPTALPPSRPRICGVALVFGPDAGLVQERAEKLLKTVVPDLTDPFNVADLSEAVLLADPARLADEAAAISMMGGRRVVRVRGAGNDLAELFEHFLDDPPGDALVVVEAGDLAKGAALRKLFEGDDKAAAIACYADNARDLEDVVRDALRAEGLSIAPDALDDAVSRLGSDRGVTRRELEKLALYAKGQKSVSAGRCARRDGRRSRSPRRGSLRCGGQRRFRPARPGAGAAVGGGHAAGRGDAQRHGPFPAPAAGRAKARRGAKIWIPR